MSSIRIPFTLYLLPQLILMHLSVMLLHKLLIEHQLPQLADLQPSGPQLQVHADEDEWHLDEVLGDLELVKEGTA